MIVIIDYGVGNLSSIRNMLKKGGVNALISGKEDDVIHATKLLLPGMGHFDNCMKKLEASGLRQTIEKKILREKTPVLGICVGLQMFMESSEEGVEKGLGWISGKTVRFNTKKMNAGLKVPNMGWLEAIVKKPSRLMEGLEKEARFYFAHSYHIELEQANQHDLLIEGYYGYNFAVGLERNNIVGVQFHPEKSHRFGLRLLNNFAVNF